MPQFSLIIPVYNTEKYLKTCLDSIINQSFDDYEIILVDDGSNDKSLEICKNYAFKDKRIKFIHQNNSGVSIARNIGLKIASGKYIWFIDSDDNIMDYSLSDLNNIVKKKGYDIIVFNTDIDETYKSDNNSLDSFFRKYYFTYKLEFSSWNKLYRREFLLQNHIIFDFREKIGEDLLFNIFCYSNMKRLKFVNKTYYNYKKRVNSAMSTQLKSRLNDQMRLFRKIVEIIGNRVNNETIEILKLIHFISGINQARKSLINIFEFKKKLKDVYKKEIAFTPLSKKTVNLFLNYQKPSFLGYIKFKLLMFFIFKKNFFLASLVVII